MTIHKKVVLAIQIITLVINCIVIGIWINHDNHLNQILTNLEHSQTISPN